MNRKYAVKIGTFLVGSNISGQRVDIRNSLRHKELVFWCPFRIGTKMDKIGQHFWYFEAVYKLN